MATSKKQVLNRLLSLTLVVVMCFGFIPIPAQASSATATLTNGMPVTVNNVLALIEEYKNGTREPGEKAKAAGFTSYADTKPTQRYDPYNPPYFGAIGSGTECAKFAFAFWDDIFGDAPYREVTDPWQVKPGDLIQYPSHWCIAVQSAYQRTGYDYPFTQAVGGGKTGSIGWGDPDASLNDILAIYTRYPIPYKFENSEVLLTSEGPIGTPLSSLEGLGSVRLRASKDGSSKDFDLPIIWDKDTYDPWTNDEQTVEGKLDISGYPELAGASLPTVTATITLTGEIEVKGVSVERPMVTVNQGASHEDVYNALKDKTITVTVTYANNETETESLAVTEWDVVGIAGGGYNPSNPDPQIIKGSLRIPSDSKLNNLSDEWKSKIVAEAEIIQKLTYSGIQLVEDPIEVFGYLGTAFLRLEDVPQSVMVRVNSAAGGDPVEMELPVSWNSTGYNPLKAEQTLTGTLSLSGSSAFDNYTGEVPTPTLKITLTQNPDDKVSSITPISPIYVAGTLGTPFTQQPFPEKVSVRITYESGVQTEAEVPVTWKDEGFNPNATGSQNVSGVIGTSELIPEDTDPAKLTVTASVNLQVRGAGINLAEIAPVKGYLGDEAGKIMGKAPQGVDFTITTSSGTETGVMTAPVEWVWSSYNPLLPEQVIHGTMSMSGSSMLEGMTSPDVKLTVILTEKPTYTADFEKEYDGKRTALPVEKPEGCSKVEIIYEGTTLSGIHIKSSSVPTEAGTYTAAVTLTMMAGYDPIDSLTVSYVIKPAEQFFDTPVQIAYTTNNTIGVTPVPGCEYRINDGEWQDSTYFDKLTPNTTYTVYQRLKGTADKNKNPSVETSATATTQGQSFTGVAIPFPDLIESKTYDGAGVLAAAGVKNGTYSFNYAGTGNVRVTVKAYLSDDTDTASEPQNYDEANAVTDPTTAGPYVISYELPGGYVWADTGSAKMEQGIWIYPKFSDIYVGDMLTDITMEGGTPDANSTAANLRYEFVLPDDPADFSFDTSHAGSTMIPVAITAGGSGASIATSRFPVTVLPWVITGKDAPTVNLANDEAFSASLLPATVAVTAKAHDREQVFQVPVTWESGGYNDSVESQSIPGTLDFSDIPELSGSADNSVSVVVTRLAAPVYVPFESRFESKTFDEKGLFDAGKDYTVEVDGVEIPVQVTAYLGSADTAVENPTAAGKYTIRTVLPDGYFWEGSTSPAKESSVWIYPSVSPIYVGDQLEDAVLIGVSGDYDFQIAANPGFSSSVSGETTISVIASLGGSTETVSVSVTILPWMIAGKQPASIVGELGTDFDALTKPATVVVTAKGSGDERAFNVPVVWSSEGYNALADSQSINGTLDFSSFPELAGLADTSVTATVKLSMKAVTAPAIDPFSKTYDGESADIPALTLPTGIESYTVSYAGTSNAGVNYGPAASAPVNAGAYTATISFTVAPGYEPLEPVTVTYTIEKAVQSGVGSIAVAVVSYDSIVMKPIDGAEYSLDGIAWQSSNSFYNLNSNTEYTVYVRMPATADGNYDASEASSMSVVTSKRDARPPELTPSTVTYSGSAMTYNVPAITGVQEAIVTYLSDGEILGGAPADAGVYDISISFVMESGYKQLSPMTSKLTILKASQTAPVAAITSAADTSLTVSNIAGAEYSIDGGANWQPSNVFANLERNTPYTILVRMAEDRNHEASPSVEVKGSTTATTSEVPSMLPAYNVTYDGSPKEYIHAASLADIEGVQTVTVTYTGTTNAGTGYRSTTPPTEAGQYAVTITMTAKPGYTLQQSLIATKLTIDRAPQDLPENPSIAKVTTATVTVNPIAGAEYSGNNGATWQSSNIFSGLAPETSFIVLVRMAETPNYLASGTISLPATTLANTGLTYDIDFRNETISFNEQVVEMSLTNFFNGTISSGTPVTPGLVLFARLVDNGTGSVGASVPIQIPERPATPDVKFNTTTYELNTTSAMEYSADNGATWSACGDNMDASFLGGSVLLVRYAATDGSFRSDAKNVFIPARPNAPALSVNLKTERLNTTSNMEYSDDGGASWNPCMPDMSLSDLAGETIMVRTKANANSPASTSAFVNVPERADAPEYSISMSAETLTANAPFEYYVNGEWTEAETLSLSSLCGQTILIQSPAADGKFASSRVSVAVPLRGETPVVEVEEQTLTINTVIGMEYSVDNGASWNAATVNMDIAPYAGMTMLVRRSVTETMFASNPAVVQIRSLGKAPVITVDNVREIADTTAEMEYSTDGGKTWTSAPDDLDVSSLTGGTLEVRMSGTATEFPSESVTVTIPVRNEAPEVSADMVSGQFAFPAGTQYSPDSGDNWMEAPNTIMDSMYGTTLLFRTPADEAHFASISVPVALPSRPDGPAVAFDMKNLTVNTTSAMEYSSDGGYSWTPAPDGLDVSGLLGKTVLFRYTATSTTPASSNTELELPAGASVPVVSVDCENEQLIASELTLEWSQDNGRTWSVCKTPMNVGEYAGRELLFRVPGTTEKPASASVPVTIPRRENTPAVDVDVVSETINTTPAMEYSLNGGLSWTQAPMSLDVSQMTGEAVLVRTAHTSSSFASHAVSVTVPTRAGSVNVSVDMEKEILNTTTGMDYSLDNGRTWTQAPAGLNVSGMTGSVVLVRSHGTGFQFAGEPVSVAVPIRKDAPTVNADLRNELFSVPDGAEFSSDGGKTWIAVPSAITSEMLGTTVLFRFPADESRFASAPAAITLPSRPDGPTLSLDRDAMTVNTTSDMEVNVDGTWMPATDNMDVSGYQGKTLQFRYAAYDTMPASSVTELTIPTVTPVPVLSLDMTNEQIVSDQEGSVLEYSEDGGETWFPCVMPMNIGDMAGKQVMFRTPADGETPCSKPVTATIPVRAGKPELALDTEMEMVSANPAEGLSFSTDGGETWMKLEGSLNISGLTGTTVLVRVSCTTEKLASEPAAIVIPNRSPAPAPVIDMTAETMSAGPSMEFSLDGGRTWTPADDAVSVSGMAGASLMLRYAHTDDTLHGESAIIAIPARLAAPDVSADLRSGKFSAPEGTEFSTDGKTWGKIPASIGEDLLGKTVFFRLPATDKNFASHTVEVALPLRSDGPVLSLNKEALTVNTDTSMEYSIDNGATWHKGVNNMSVAGLLGKTLTVRYAAVKGAPASSETTLVIPTRGPAPTVTAYNVSAYGRNDGVITGTNTSMEYRRAGVSSWTKVTGSSIGFLSAGTYEIRYAATANSIASESRIVTIYSPAPGQTGPGTNPGNPGGSNPGGGFYPSNPGSGSTGSFEKRYTVKFETNGGGSIKSQTVDRNGYVEAPQVPVREGYTFLGWYSDAKLTKLYDFETKVKSSFTLYAGWTETYISDDGSSGSNGGYVDPTPVDPTPVNPAPDTNTSLVDGDLGTSYVNGRAPGKFEPNAGITRGEVAAILFRLLSENAKTRFYAQSNDFVDVPSDSWYNEAISTLVQAGVLGGYGDGTFRPDQPVTRAELAAILVRVQGGSASAGNTTFTDTDGHWAEGYISSAVSSGLVFGYDDGSFKPNRSITRAEAVTMMNRLLMRSPMSNSDTGSVSFTDVQSSDWFYGNVMAAANGYLG